MRNGRPTMEQAAHLAGRIRQAALELFLEHGYDGVSMDAIARAAGTTKVTLYARFPGKEQLFVAVLEWAIGRPDWPVPEAPAPPPDDLPAALEAVAAAALRRALDPAMIRLSRIAVTHADRFPQLARRQAGASWPRQHVVADLLRHHAASGGIVADDPDALAELFLGMVVGMPARLASYGITRPPPEMAARTRSAVDLFVRGLRPS